ncbi:uncharacterized protein BDR25DRAFT_350936 [Lindgomyces ingoldianus]|uniref:Uncharacterized protein n=1 Tax=Lindgomyces ingoldianus TaxID=673940 RepID=A0ACB6RAL8_9PLEO|nr:uncharacterized protein BDR25DRAFT_350936 [Lindgomyces ingoldianus]KAF2475572.1 hypothetical protein BDR25DRAFT_350936 [Lindgomyces ingoldianus]
MPHCLRAFTPTNTSSTAEKPILITTMDSDNFVNAAIVTLKNFWHSNSNQSPPHVPLTSLIPVIKPWSLNPLPPWRLRPRYIKTAPILHTLGGTAFSKGRPSALPSEAENARLVAERFGNLRITTINRSFSIQDLEAGHYSTRNISRMLRRSKGSDHSPSTQKCCLVDYQHGKPATLSLPLLSPFKIGDVIEEWFNHKLLFFPFAFERFLFSHQDISAPNITVTSLGQAEPTMPAWWPKEPTLEANMHTHFLPASVRFQAACGH